MIDNTDYCLFCNKLKDWDSNIRITGNDDRLIFKATVCPDCKRQYTIDHMFKRYAQLVEFEYQEATDSDKDTPKEVISTESED